MRALLRAAGRLAPVLTCLALFLLFSVTTPTFLSRDNVVNILQQNSVLAIMAVGVTFVLLCAEIDLSIAFMATLSGVIAAMTYVSLANAVPGWIAQAAAIGAAVGACAALGCINGLGTARLGLPSFMMTIAMSLLAKGLALRLTLGQAHFHNPAGSRLCWARARSPCFTEPERTASSEHWCRFRTSSSSRQFSLSRAGWSCATPGSVVMCTWLGAIGRRRSWPGSM